MARAALKTDGPTLKEGPQVEIGVLHGRDSRAESAALTSTSSLGRDGPPRTWSPRALEPFATTGTRLVAALDKALEAISPPAFVIACHGEILRSNAPARLLLTQENDVRTSLTRAISIGAAEPMWDLAPLGERDRPAGFLAIYRRPWRTTVVAEALRKARRTWKLTSRQIEVLDLVAKGFTNDLIAEQLKIRKGTVEFHLSAIFDKAGVNDRATLVIQMLNLR